MIRKLFVWSRYSLALGIVISFFFFQIGFAQDSKSIQLPSPDTQGGKPLMQALKERKTSREFSNKPLPLEVISDLLWAAGGINRNESGGRTAPTAMNCQEIDIYAAMDSGLYLYEPVKNRLTQILAQDIRAVTGRQEFVKNAPLNLIYVADLSRAAKMGAHFEFYAGCDTGFISQNVYLYCASAGLSTVVRGMFDQAELAKAMKLKPNQKIILTQTVGYPIGTLP
ncbi:MAG: SagB/ThcOx family dehydrogenase [Candidatus Omnitrophica bacterium]|nr:SagB/ThcOx family dehydrogenase [Candidatus Omnitrophota bacterium]